MYNEFFGLQKSPFALTPDPEFLYLTAQHREAVAGLTYAILGRRGFVVLTGGAGTGKTTVLRRILQHLPENRIQSSMIVNPTLTPAEFLEAALMDFGLDNIPASKAQRIAILQDFLWAGFRAGKVSALIVDEAHKLTPELIEELRLLGNFESDDQKLLQILLVGQPELDSLLNHASLTQFKQRISLRLSVAALSEAEIGQYIQYRWLKAGGSKVPFAADAIASIGRAAKGVPRVINLLCDNCLMLAFGEQSPSVEQRHILTVCRELQFAAPVPQPAEAHGETPSFEMAPMRTLARYQTSTRTSWLAKLATKFKFRQRIEPA